jgi:hypothetical protein
MDHQPVFPVHAGRLGQLAEGQTKASRQGQDEKRLNEDFHVRSPMTQTNQSTLPEPSLTVELTDDQPELAAALPAS